MATIYVAPSPTGDDSRTYAQAQNPATPWATPGKFMTSGVNGDTCILANGTYVSTGSWTPSFGFTMQAQNVGMAIISGGGAGYIILLLSSALCVFSGIVFSNFTYAAGGGYGLIWDARGNATFQNCTFKSLVLDHHISGGIFTPAFDTIVFTITGCLFYGLTAASPGATAGLVHTRLHNGFTVNFFGNTIYGAPSIVFRGNTTETINIVLKNNIFYRATSGAFSYTCTLAGTYNNNCGYNYTGAPSGSGNLTSDPLMVNPANEKFGLRPNSPCRSAGVTI